MQLRELDPYMMPEEQMDGSSDEDGRQDEDSGPDEAAGGHGPSPRGGSSANSANRRRKAAAGSTSGATANATGERILCRICGDSAVRHVHYGGHCCFSCKAFFRRAVNWQSKNNRTFQCKFEGRCEITIRNRKTCQACRFQKCNLTGMNPAWVLSDDQRKKRFKKYRDRLPDAELSPASSQDSVDGEPRSLLETIASAAAAEPTTGRRRARSAPGQPAHSQARARRGHRHPARLLAFSTPVSPQETSVVEERRLKGRPSGGGLRSPAAAGGRALAPAAALSPPTVKTETLGSPGTLMSPLAENFGDLDFDGPSAARRLASCGDSFSNHTASNHLVTGPHHHQRRVHHQQRSPVPPPQRQAGGDESGKVMDQSQQHVLNIKEEVADLDLESLHGLISTCDFTVDLDIKPPVVVSPPLIEAMSGPPTAPAPSAVTMSPLHLQQHLRCRLPPGSPVSPTSGGCAPAYPQQQVFNSSLSPGQFTSGNCTGTRYEAYSSPPGTMIGRPSAIVGFPTLPRQPIQSMISPLKRPHSDERNGDTNGYHHASVEGGVQGGLLLATAVPRQHQQTGHVLAEEEMLGLMKLEMSFENSNSSLPCMSPETAAIWNDVLSSYKFELLKNSFHFDWISEAIEVSLRRNLIFMQENADFTSLSVEERRELYIQNMKNLCIVRGIMQRQPSSIHFNCSSSNSQLEVSYLHPRTGKMTYWQTGSQPATNHSSSSRSSLLQLSETVWGLRLERTAYLLILLVVLFSSQSTELYNARLIDRLQNKYLALLYRFLQSKHGQADAQKYLAAIMKLVLTLLAEHY